MNEINNRFKMGYGKNLNKRNHNTYYVDNSNRLPLRLLNNHITHTNNIEINRAIQKHLIQERMYKMYKMKLQSQNNILTDTNIKKLEESKKEEKEENENKEILLTEIYTNEEQIAAYKNTKSPHFKDYDSVSEKTENELIREEVEEDDLNEDSIDTDIDSD